MAKPDELLPDDDPASRRPRIACEFCECDLTPSGELKGKLSTKAKAYRDMEDTLDAVRDDLNDATQTIERLKGELAAAKAALPIPSATPPPSSGDKNDVW